METKLPTWLGQQLNERKWSIREMSRRCGWSHTQISDILNRHARASADFCIAIAKPLGYDPVEVLRIGGHLLSPLTDARRVDPLLAELYAHYTGLSPGDQQIAVRIVRGLDATAISTGYNPRPLEEVESQRQPMPEGGKRTTSREIEPDPHAPYIEVLAEIWDSLTVEQMEQSIVDYVRLVWDHLPEHVKVAYCEILADHHLGE